jgi:putative Holliday junction resolvase
MTLRTGVRLALDWGDARIGVAKCDASGTLAFPYATVRAGTAELDELAALVSEEGPIEVVVGLPRSLAGGEGPAAAKVRSKAVALAAALGPSVPVRLVDERLTTVTASRRLSESGKRLKQQRSLIDAAAAVAILEHALDLERARDAAPGELVSAADTAE